MWPRISSHITSHKREKSFQSCSSNYPSCHWGMTPAMKCVWGLSIRGNLTRGRPLGGNPTNSLCSTGEAYTGSAPETGPACHKAGPYIVLPRDVSIIESQPPEYFPATSKLLWQLIRISQPSATLLSKELPFPWNVVIGVTSWGVDFH